jgi:hypothetical protein
VKLDCELSWDLSTSASWQDSNGCCTGGLAVGFTLAFYYT